MPRYKKETSFKESWLRIAAGGLRVYEVERLLGCSDATASRLMASYPQLGSRPGDAERVNEKATWQEIHAGLLKQLQLAARNRNAALAPTVAVQMSTALARMERLAAEGSTLTEEERIEHVGVVLRTLKGCECGPMPKPPEPQEPR